MVACGYSQVEGQDYTEVFAATLKAANFRLFCCLIATRDWETDQIDAVKASTQSDVDAEIYVEMPEGFTVSGYVLKLRKALEGIKQGAHLWFNKNRQALESVGFKASLSEPNLYVHSEHPIIIAVFVDDILAGFAPEATDTYLHVKAEYGKLINVGAMDVCPVRKFTGVEVIRDRQARTITLTQTGYIKELALRYKGQCIESYSPTGPERASQDKFRRLQVEAEGRHEQRIPTTTYLLEAFYGQLT